MGYLLVLTVNKMISQKVARILRSAEFDVTDRQVREFNKTAKLNDASVEYRKDKIARIVLEISA